MRLRACSRCWMAALLLVADFAGDLTAGITVGAMLIPQGMAYALLAGLPPQVGLYASMLPLVVYAMLGRSRQLGFGPTAISSLIVAAALGPLAAGDAEPVRRTGRRLLAVIVGVLRIGLGVARLGFVVNFLSGPVLMGFTAAAAVTIGLSQAKHVLGVRSPTVPRRRRWWPTSSGVWTR